MHIGEARAEVPTAGLRGGTTRRMTGKSSKSFAALHGNVRVRHERTSLPKATVAREWATPLHQGL